MARMDIDLSQYTVSEGSGQVKLPAAWYKLRIVGFEMVQQETNSVKHFVPTFSAVVVDDPEHEGTPVLLGFAINSPYNPNAKQQRANIEGGRFRAMNEALGVPLKGFDTTDLFNREMWVENRPNEKEYNDWVRFRSLADGGANGEALPALMPPRQPKPPTPGEYKADPAAPATPPTAGNAFKFGRR